MPTVKITCSDGVDREVEKTIFLYYSIAFLMFVGFITTLAYMLSWLLSAIGFAYLLLGGDLGLFLYSGKAMIVSYIILYIFSIFCKKSLPHSTKKLLGKFR